MHIKSILNFIFSPFAQLLSFYLLLIGSNGIILPFIMWSLAGLLFSSFSFYNILYIFYFLLILLSPIFLFFNGRKNKNLFTSLSRIIATIIMILIVSISLFNNYKLDDGGYTFKETIPFISFLFFILVNFSVLFKVINFYISKRKVSATIV